MKTIFLLMAQYDGQAIIPAERVCADYFAPMLFTTFIQKVNAGKIALPITRMDPSQKGPRGVHVADLAAYIDQRREAGLRELDALRSATRSSLDLDGAPVRVPGQTELSYRSALAKWRQRQAGL